MEKRYQVFVSSTYQDLQEERQEVMNALLELDCMPSGMELFPAANDSQWNLIKKVIDDCDYYILILGGRYGSIGPDGLSYTEMEYRYALETDKPIIAFTHGDPGKIHAEKTESTDEGKAKLAAFRALVETKLCKRWHNPQELGSVVSRSLVQLIRSTPAIGWVRANELADKDATAELLKLRRRVDELEGELAVARTAPPKGSELLAQGSEQHAIRYEFTVRNSESFDSAKYEDSVIATWDELFAAIAPLMLHEATEAELKSGYDKWIQSRELPSLREDGDFAGCEIKYFHILDADLQTLVIQFRALGLIAKSTKPRSVRDANNYWTLTPLGDELMTRIRAVRSGTASPGGADEAAAPGQPA